MLDTAYEYGFPPRSCDRETANHTIDNREQYLKGIFLGRAVTPNPAPPLMSSLEAKEPILVWIMKVKGPKNQADFIEVLYVVVNAWGASF